MPVHRSHRWNQFLPLPPPLEESAVSSTRHNEAVRENQTRLFFLLQRHSRPLKKKQPAQLSHIGPLADNNNIILATMLPTLAERNRCFAIWTGNLFAL